MQVVLALVVFVVAHVLMARPMLKAGLIARVGERAYLVVYSIVSLVLFAWVLGALLRAPREVLWPTPSWAYGFAPGVSLASFVLIGIGVATPNPFSVSVRRAAYDRGRPGVVGWIRHPILIGLGGWGLAHLPANGDWPSLVLFVGASAFAFIGVFTVGQRKRRRLGSEAFAHLEPAAGHWDRRATIGTAFGVAAWAAFLWLHPMLFGVDPLSALLAMLSAGGR